MQAETTKPYTPGQDSRAVTANDLVRGGVLFLFCHVLFIVLGMLAYFAG